MLSHGDFKRAGTFSSSSIWKLTTTDRSGNGFGKPALEYIREKQIEKRLKRQLQGETMSRSTNWGKFVEKLVFDLLGIEYQLESKTRYFHKDIPLWSGMPDVVTNEKVGDIKSPFTLKSFCDLVDSFESVDRFKDYSPEYYWQLVSNAILTGKDVAELIVYVPYQSELSAIRQATQDYDGNQNDIAFINWADDNELPYLIEGEYYRNINIFTFEVLDSEKQFLTELVSKAATCL